jgi:hypothetical protein
MSKNEVCLSAEVEHLLTSGDESRLTENDLIQLKVHLKMIAGWADRVPRTARLSVFYSGPVAVVPRVSGVSREQMAIAIFLQPLHCHLCGIAIQVLWKADQLIRGLCTSLNCGDMIVAATMARSLIETSASFGVETDAITTLWKGRKIKPAPDVGSLEDFHSAAFNVVGQILFGTRIKKEKQPVTGIERTSIMTLIDKAERISTSSGLRRDYEILCDTVHPSLGASRCFWTKEPEVNEDRLEIEMNRDSLHAFGDLLHTIGRTAIWSLQWLGLMWCFFERTRNDICLTARVYALPQRYYGVITPGDPSGYCKCGSARPERECIHEFGVG